jgi:hypothetical protein
MTTSDVVLRYLSQTYSLDLTQRQQPIEIPNTNRETLAQLFGRSASRAAWKSAPSAASTPRRCVWPIPACSCSDRVSTRGKPTAGTGITSTSGSSIGSTKKRRNGSSPTADARANVQRRRRRDVTNGSLDFVYIDGNHRFEQVVADLAAWAPKVRPGGIVAGHDYLKAKLPSLMHVPQAIHAWIDAYADPPAVCAGPAREDRRRTSRRRAELVLRAAGAGAVLEKEDQAMRIVRPNDNRVMHISDVTKTQLAKAVNEQTETIKKQQDSIKRMASLLLALAQEPEAFKYADGRVTIDQLALSRCSSARS